MITSRFINFFMIFILVNLTSIILVNVDWKNKRTLSFLGCLVSLMIIVSVCFFPFPMQKELLEEMIANNEGIANNFVPFRSIFTYIKEAIENHILSIIAYQIFGNILLFVPFGVSLYFYSNNKGSIIKIVVCIIFTSLSIEILQGFFGYLFGVNYRSVDIDDIFLNTTGGLLGACIASYFKQLVTIRSKRKK